MEHRVFNVFFLRLIACGPVEGGGELSVDEAAALPGPNRPLPGPDTSFVFRVNRLDADALGYQLPGQPPAMVRRAEDGELKFAASLASGQSIAIAALREGVQIGFGSFSVEQEAQPFIKERVIAGSPRSRSAPPSGCSRIRRPAQSPRKVPVPG